MVMLHNHKISNIVANILPADHPAQPKGLVSKGQNSLFSEHGHVVYQVKWNYVCSIITEDFLPAEPPSTPPGHGVCGQKVKNHHFQKMVMIHIKLMGMTRSATL